MRIENSVTGRDFRFYSDSGKFLGTMVTNPTGERIYVKSLRSSEFYRNIDMIWEYVNVVSGTHIWNAHVEPAHFKALLRIAGDPLPDRTGARGKVRGPGYVLYRDHEAQLAR